jgi:1,4-dihydroxy-2-naphthoate octaprenyltransferase
LLVIRNHIVSRTTQNLNDIFQDINGPGLLLIAMWSSENYWYVLAVIGIFFILFAGFYTGIPTWLNYLDYGFLSVGAVFLILAAIEFRRQKKV